jgi:hypothetical protein
LTEDALFDPFKDVNNDMINEVKSRYGDLDAFWSPGTSNGLSAATIRPTDHPLKCFWEEFMALSKQEDVTITRLSFFDIIMEAMRRNILQNESFHPSTRARGRINSDRARDTMALHFWGTSNHTSYYKQLGEALQRGRKKYSMAMIFSFGVFPFLGKRVAK